MDLFNKVHKSEPLKVHNLRPNIRLIRLFSLMFNYAKPRMLNLEILKLSLHIYYSTVVSNCVLQYQILQKCGNKFW